MIPATGESTTIIGPDGKPRLGRILNTYRSTGGFLTVWIELDEGLANPANWVVAECTTRVLVLTERDGIYRDLWQGRWQLEAG
jgi:hypothetical protein